ncbi:MAG: hypothetical protein RI904_2683 [Pseudomonadota bacterium]
MQLNPSEISELLKNRIAGLGTSSDIRTQGTSYAGHGRFRDRRHYTHSRFV